MATAEMKELVDPRVRTLVMPTRVMWVSESDDRSSVDDADVLLEEKQGQVPEGLFLAGSGCRMENRSAPAAMLVDFGRELHGGVQLASGGPSGKDVKVRVRFGESLPWRVMIIINLFLLVQLLPLMQLLRKHGLCLGEDLALDDVLAELPVTHGAVSRRRAVIDGAVSRR